MISDRKEKTLPNTHIFATFFSCHFTLSLGTRVPMIMEEAVDGLLKGRRNTTNCIWQ
jgi:hypothetical protein